MMRANSRFRPRAAVFGSTVLAVAMAGEIFGLTGGCAVTGQAKTEQLPDGTYKLTCKQPLPHCLQSAEQTCQGRRYVVLRAADHNDYVGAQNSAGEAQIRTSEAIIRCGTRGRAWWGPEANPMATDQPTSTADGGAPGGNPGGRACLPGATQRCTGAGACQGGQFCLPDGSGFSPCDCGPGSSPQQAPAGGGGDGAPGTSGAASSGATTSPAPSGPTTTPAPPAPPAAPASPRIMVPPPPPPPPPPPSRP